MSEVYEAPFLTSIEPLLLNLTMAARSVYSSAALGERPMDEDTGQWRHGVLVGPNE